MIVTLAAYADGVGSGAGEGIALGVTVIVALVRAASCPGAADTVYCALPGPVTVEMLQFRLESPSLRTVKDWAGGAGCPQTEEKVRDVGETDGPDRTPLPVSRSAAGSGWQSALVEAIAIEPVLLAADGEKTTESVCVPVACNAKRVLETVNGEVPASDPDATDSVTFAGAFPLFVTLKSCDAVWCRTTGPNPPKPGVAIVSNARTAPFGCSVSVIACEFLSASVSIVRVAVIGVSAETAGTGGAWTVTWYVPTPPSGAAGMTAP